MEVEKKKGTPGTIVSNRTSTNVRNSVQILNKTIQLQCLIRGYKNDVVNDIIEESEWNYNF